MLQVYVNTMTLQHFLCLSSFVLPFLPNQITSLLLICDPPSPRHVTYHLFVLYWNVLDCWIRFIHHQVVWSTLVLYYNLLRSQVRFIQVLKDMVSQTCCFPVPWITSSGFSWITSRHNQSLLSRLEEETDQTEFCFNGSYSWSCCNAGWQCGF